MSRSELRVLHVIDGLGTGGAERSLAELLPRMRELGVISSVACLTRKPEGVHELVERDGFPVEVIGRARLRAGRRLRQMIATWRPDIVHTTIFEADVIGRLAAAGHPCRVVTSLVNTTYDGARVADAEISPIKLAAAKAVDGVTARHLTDHFHAITHAVRDSAVSHLRVPPGRITVIERGRSLARLGESTPERRAAVRQALGLAPDAQVVLNVGRQEPQKGQAVLLRAIAGLASGRPRLVLLQAGREGKATPQLRSIAEGLGGSVRFLGHRDDVGDLLAAADVFVFPSVYEGLGGSVLEAMGMRVPIVVTDVPALLEVVEDGRAASVVRVGDVGELAGAISRLLADPVLAERVAARGFETFNRRFTLDRSADRMVALYRTVVDEPQPHRAPQ